MENSPPCLECTDLFDVGLLSYLFFIFFLSILQVSPGLLESPFVTFVTFVVHLAPSPRLTAYLLRQGKLKLPTMALTNVDHVSPSKPVEKTPDVLVTPCDPWPAPYYLDGGFRRVTPYHFTYNTNCKERWRGRQLVEIFTSEFRDRKPEYYVREYVGMGLQM